MRCIFINAKDKPKRSPGAYRRARGADGERELSKLIQSYGFEAQRSQQFCGNSGDADVRTNISGIYIECKRYKVFPGDSEVAKWMKKAVEDCPSKDLTPIIFYREDRKPWYCYFEKEYDDDMCIISPTSLIVRCLATSLLTYLKLRKDAFNDNS